MNTHGAILTEGFIKDLYLGLNRQNKEPLLQILGFQISEVNPKEIILRISDKETFIDCPLIGPYRIHENKIISSSLSPIVSTFQKFDIIRVTDYFSKIEESKICHLKIIIRKIMEINHLNQKIGLPQEIAQFVQNNKLWSQKRVQKNGGIGLTFKNPELLANGKHQINAIKIQDLEEQNYGNSNYPQPLSTHISPSNIFPPSGMSRQSQMNPIIKYDINKQRDPETPLTLRDILDECDGFFIGRLLRMKSTLKETKDGPMTVLFLGFLDKNQQMVRINIAGRMALKQEKNLKKGKCYYIKGIQLIKSKVITPQIRLKDKEYKIHEIANEEITSQYKNQYFHWDHEYQYVEYQNVDVIGIIDDIQEKTSYRQTNSNDQRDVVRVIIRNKFKTVKVSFWADQIKNLEGFDLKKKAPIILQDIKKKKSFFLDFTFESNLIKLSQDPKLKERFQDLLPSSEQRPQPKNIKELKEIYEQEPSNTKVRNLNVVIIKIHQNRIIYKLCEDCKKKVERTLQTCKECGTSNFAYKFNCQIQFADMTDSITAIVFDLTAHKLFNKSASEINDMTNEQVEQLIQSFQFKEFVIGFQNKREKIVVRMAQPVEDSETLKNTEQNIKQIRRMLAQH